MIKLSGFCFKLFQSEVAAESGNRFRVRIHVSINKQEVFVASMVAEKVITGYAISVFDYVPSSVSVIISEVRSKWICRCCSICEISFCRSKTELFQQTQIHRGSMMKN